MTAVATPDMKAAALSYAARFGLAVVPIHSPNTEHRSGCDCRSDDCTSPAKHPRTLHGLRDASLDAQEIENWWTMWPTANIAAPTGGMARYVVLDVDPGHGGDESLRNLEAQHGVLPTTPTVRTGGAGYHYWFKAPDGATIRNSVGKLAPGLVIRAGGGYAVLPPSLHVSGERYEWLADAHIRDTSVAELPPWLVVLLTEPERRSPAASVEGRIPEGQRNAILASLAGTMRRSGMTETEIAAALLTANVERAAPPLPKSEVLRIAASVAKYEPAREVPNLPRTDAGNGELFARLHGDHVRYNHKRGQWLLFGEHHWHADRDGALRRLAKDTARRWLDIAKTTPESKESKQAAEFAFRSEAKVRLDAMLELAKSERPVADDGDGWDANPMLLGVANGVVNLKTGDLRDGRPEDKITLSAPVEYDPDAACPRWTRFLDEVFDEELIAFVGRMAGYCSTGDVREQILVLLYGTGSNGKTVFLNTLRRVTGDYALNLPFSTFELQGRSALTPDLAMLPGKRLVTSAETNAGTRLNEARIKTLTGGDPITANPKHRDPFTFDPAAKFLLSTNHLPVVRDDSDGFWRKIRVLPFNMQFEGAERDKGLESALVKELPGILAWMVRGAVEWHANGMGEPNIVLLRAAAWRAESDEFTPFIQDRCMLANNAEVAASTLFAAYISWAIDMSIPERERLSSKTFGSRMGERFERKNARSGRVYHGIGLRDDRHGEPSGAAAGAERGGSDSQAARSRAPTTDATTTNRGNVEGSPDSGGGSGPRSDMSPRNVPRVEKKPGNPPQPSTPSTSAQQHGVVRPYVPCRGGCGDLVPNSSMKCQSCAGAAVPLPAGFTSTRGKRSS